MKCPDCEDGTSIASHVKYSDGTHGYGVEFKCGRCKGTGNVPEVMAEWIAKGKQLKERRRDPYRTLHEEAKRRGMDAVTLSAMETGRIERIL